MIIVIIRLVEGDDYSDNQTGGRIIHFRLLFEKVRDSYFGVFWS